jgi:hypothetical protein
MCRPSVGDPIIVQPEGAKIGQLFQMRQPSVGDPIIDAGQRVKLSHPHEFWLGPTLYGPYGIPWFGSAARANYEYWVEWPAPFDPMRFDWLGNDDVFCPEDAGADAIAQARPARVSEAMGFG